MPFLVRGVPLALGASEDELPRLVARRLRVPVEAIRAWSILARSIDARRKDVHFTYQVEVALNESPRQERARLRRFQAAQVAWIDSREEPPPQPGRQPLAQRPLVIGFGPGGMFAALRLAEMGYQPLVLERGREVRRRHRDVLLRFYRQRDFDPESNLLFGEGGAGAYSDGKLYTRVGDSLCRQVLEMLYRNGADPDILIDSRPHIGSDRLPTICTRIRRRIESLGGEVRFECQLDDIRMVEGRLSAIHVTGCAAGIRSVNGSDPELPSEQPADRTESNTQRVGEWITVGPVVLAVGHSARDTIRMLAQRGVRIDPKPFQIGVRIEHPQALVDRWQFGAAAGHVRLGAAEYHLVAKGAAGDCGDMFSFCMCPGGVILPTNESAGLVVTNGASLARRRGPLANSGLVLTLDPLQLGLSAMDALSWVERWERLAYEATGDSYRVPCQRAADFLESRLSDGRLETSYPLGGMWCDVRGVIPKQAADALLRALPLWERKFPGFASGESVITAPETRASAPLRMTREPVTREALGVAGLYPVGEGAGYAGGIVSAAVDGLKTADTIIGLYAPP